MAWPIILDGTTFNEADFLGTAYAGTWQPFFAALINHLQNLPTATSTTSVTVGTGTKSLVIQAGKWYSAGWPIRLYRTSAPLTTYMDGIVSAYDSVTGALDVSVGAAVGSGTYTDWSLAIGGARVAGTLPLSLSEGGTGSTTQSGARASLGVGENNGDGTNSAPALAFASDADTGIFRIGANNLGFATGGVLRVSVGSTGRLGVGTNSPYSMIHAFSGASGQASASANADELVIENSANAGLSILAPSTATTFICFGDEASTNPGQISYNHATDALALRANAADRLTITSAGQFQANNSGSATVPTYSFTSSTDAGMWRIDATNIGFAVGGAEALRITAAGPAAQLGSATAPSISFSGDSNTGVYSPGADQVAITTGGTQRLLVGSGGQVGFVQGSASTPAISFIADTNTGIHNPSADTVAIACNGANVVQISPSGMVNSTGGAYAAVNTPQSFTAPQRGALSSVAYAASVTLDLSTSNHFSIGALTGNITLNNPTNQMAGQSGVIFLTQDATGSRTISYGTNWLFEGGVDPALSTPANSRDVLSYFVESSGNIYCTLLRGFA